MTLSDDIFLPSENFINNHFPANNPYIIWLKGSFIKRWQIIIRPFKQQKNSKLFNYFVFSLFIFLNFDDFLIKTFLFSFHNFMQWKFYPFCWCFWFLFDFSFFYFIWCLWFFFYHHGKVTLKWHDKKKKQQRDDILLELQHFWSEITISTYSTKIATFVSFRYAEFIYIFEQQTTSLQYGTTMLLCYIVHLILHLQKTHVVEILLLNW